MNPADPLGASQPLPRDEVIKEFPQSPQYGAVLSAGHTEGGDYLFEKRQY